DHTHQETRQIKKTRGGRENQMAFSEAQEELVLRSWKAMKPDSESIALKFFLRCPFTCIAHAVMHHVMCPIVIHRTN
uniref:Uncharacterized protein n=1 Tax=Aegilops tauschii subsp. strangulata TaxID=200361 RepID=A0A452ZK85_AEGTS